MLFAEENQGVAKSTFTVRNDIETIHGEREIARNPPKLSQNRNAPQSL
jgi:hypothetical protein